MFDSLRVRLTLIFVGLAIGPSLLVGVVVGRRSVAHLEQQSLALQREIAIHVGNEINAFIEARENQLIPLNTVYGLGKLEATNQRLLLLSLLNHEKAFQNIALLDANGQQQIWLSSTNVSAGTASTDRAEDEAFLYPKTHRATYFGPIRFDEKTHIPFMTFSVPLFDLRSDELIFVVVADLRLKLVWDLLANLELPHEIDVYVTDQSSKIVAHRDPSVVLRDTTVDFPVGTNRATGLSGADVIFTHDVLQFGDQQLIVITEQPTSDAMRLASDLLDLTIGVTLTALAIAVSLVVLSVRQIVRPIEALVLSVQAISNGDFSRRVSMSSRGEVRTLANSFNSMSAQLQQLVTGLQQEITERKRAEEDRQQYVEQLQVLREIDRAILASESPAAIANGALQQLQNLIPYQQASVEIYAPDANRVEVLAVQGETPSPDSETTNIPLIVQDYLIGALSLIASEPGVFTPKHLEIARAVANQLAISIHQAHLFNTEQQRRRVAEMLYRTSSVISSSLGLTPMLDMILQQLRAVLDCDGASFMEIDNDHLVITACQGFHKQDEIIGSRIPINIEHPNWQVVKEHIAVSVADVHQEYPQFFHIDGTVTHEIKRIRSWMGVPLLSRNDIMGAISLDRLEVRPFTEEEIALAMTFANQAAVAIRNIRLFAAEQNRRRIAETLVQTAEAINSTLELDRVLNLILTQLRAAVECNNVTILELENEALVIKTCQGFSDAAEMIGGRVEFDSFPPFKHVVMDQKPMALTRLYDEFPQIDSEGDLILRAADIFRIKSWMGVPLLLRNNVIGAIAVDRFEVKPYTSEEIELVTAIANQAAMAIENARLFEQLQRHAEELEQRVEERTAELTVANTQLHQQIAEREQAEQALQISEERHRIITELISDYIYSIIVHPDQSVETGWMSGAVERITGYTADEIRALPGGWNSIVQPEAIGEFETMWPRLMSGHTIVHEYQITTKNGEVRWLRDYKRPLWNQAEQRITLIWGAVQDITERKQAEEELHILNRMKDEFVSNVSHELRTPVTNLVLRQHLLTRQPEKLNTHLPVMERETNRLKNMIEDLLSLSRLDQGRTEVNLTPLNLNNLLQQYVDDRVLLAGERNLSLTFRGEANLPVVAADAGLLGQVLGILLTNAINYTPSGGHVVVATQCRSIDNRAWTGFSVTDDGLGISPEDQDRIFERFFRGELGHQSEAPGTGLGLAIAREIIEQHHGRIEVASDGVPGNGTTFSVWLPVGSAPDAVG